MGKVKVQFLLVVFCLFVLGVGSATALPNPDPVNWYDDDYTELFVPNKVILSVEIFDLPDLTPGFSSEFGFYFGSDDPRTIANQVTVFGSEDLTDLTPGLDQSAAVDFSSGYVLDLDESTYQDSFAPESGSIGFYYTLFNDSTGEAPSLYTTTSYNAFGDVGTFASKTLPNTYLLGFEFPSLLGNQLFALEIVGGVEPVPEPSTLLLLVVGLVGLVPALRRKKKL